LVKFQQFLIEFQQIPAIPAKFRENFNEKYDILTDFEQILQKLEKSSIFAKFCKNPKKKLRSKRCKGLKIL